MRWYLIIPCNIIYGVASNFGYGSARGDPDVWIGLDHLRFGMDRGYGSACGFRVWIGLYILTRSYTIIMINNIPSMVTHGISNINEIPWKIIPHGRHGPQGLPSNLHHLVLIPEGAGAVTSRQHHDVPKGPLRDTAGPERQRAGQVVPVKKWGPDVIGLVHTKLLWCITVDI